MKNFWKIAALAFLVLPVFAANEEAKEMTEAPALNWDAAPIDLVLQTYGEQVGKTILKDPQVPNANITLKSREGQKLSVEEYLEAIEVVLEMNGVHLEPYGDSFIRALPRREVRKEGIPLFMDPKDADLDRNPGVVVSVMIKFENISYEEAQKALEGFKSNNGILLCFERTNSILVTDTKHNISRMLEIAKSIDRATPVTENVFVHQIMNANVMDVQKALQAIVDDSMKELEKAGKGVQNAASNSSSSSTTGRNLLNRNKNDAPAAPQGNDSLVMNMSDADRGMIRGKVLILADERSNKLIIVTSEANNEFFKRVIKELDVETIPDIKVEVIRLKYADAEDVSDMINDLIGNANSSSSTKNNQNQNAKSGTSGNLSKNTKTPTNSSTTPKESKAGELSKENVTVLADKRINGLVIMARAVDMPVLKQIINSMDIKLSQVLIETVIIEVGLGDGLNTGIDWVQNNWSGKNGNTGLIGGGGGTNGSTVNMIQGRISPEDQVSGAKSYFGLKNDQNPTQAQIQEYVKQVVATQSPAGAGITTFLKSDKLNLSAVINATKTDSNAKYLASPVVMTVDNKEATIEATESRKFYSGSTSSSGSYNNNVSYNYSDKDIGIKIKVKPKINPNGTVMLEVEEEYSQLGAGQTMLVSTSSGSPSSENVDTALTRKMSADISLENGQTVVLGGLYETSIAEKETGIPILKDIPYIGKWLFGSVSQEEAKKELLVFMTPYVIDDAESAQKEAARRKKALSDARPWDDNGWSKSELADPISTKEILRRQGEEWKKQDEEHDAARQLDKAKLERAKELEERAKKEAEEDVKAKGNEAIETDSVSADQ